MKLIPRDPRRIPRICEKICIIWELMPEIRFGQLLIILILKYGLFPAILKDLAGTLFSQEDTETEEKLDELILQLNEENRIK